MQLYSGFDLHSNNCHLGIIDKSGKRIFKKKLSNEPERILQTGSVPGSGVNRKELEGHRGPC